MKKLNITIVLLMFFATNKVNAQALIEPYNNQGSYLFAPITSNGAVLPNVVQQYIPTSGLGGTLGAGATLDAPSIGGIASAVTVLVATFKGETQSGKNLWNIAMLVSIAGLLISSFLTYQSVIQGKKQMGEATTGMITKISITFLFMIYLVPNVPPMMIGLTNYVTEGVSGWYKGNGLSSSPINQQIAQTQLDQRLAEGSKTGITMQKAATAIAKSFETTDPKLYTDLLSSIYNSQKLADLITATNNQSYDDIKKAAMDAIPDGDEAVNQAIYNGVQAQVVAATEEIIANIKTTMLASKYPTTSSDVARSFENAAYHIDRSKHSRPRSITRTASYIAFAYLGIGIWGAGIGAIIWMMLFSLPEEWGMKDILFSGLKGIIGVVLTALLITIYLTASLNIQDEVANKDISKALAAHKSAGDIAKNAAKEVQKANATGVIATFLHRGKFAGQLASTALNVAGEIITGGQVMSALNKGVTGDNVIEDWMLAALIISSPAQAAALIKGANGIGEKMQTATTAGGGADRGLYSLINGGNSTQTPPGTYPFDQSCWVAREVYGKRNPLWKIFRMWLLQKAPLRRKESYLKNGEKIAIWLKNKPKMKKKLRRWMNKCILSFIIEKASLGLISRYKSVRTFK